MILWELVLAFFKIGFFTLGGGYAMLTIIQQEIARHGWMTAQQFVDVVGIAEMTPGPIAVNAATFVGYRSAGYAGALLATCAVVLPSLISVTIVSRVWEKYKSSPVVQSMFAGIRPVVAGLVGAAALVVGRATLQSYAELHYQLITLALAGAVFYGAAVKKWDPIKLLLGCALLGLVLFR